MVLFIIGIALLVIGVSVGFVLLGYKTNKETYYTEYGTKKERQTETTKKPLKKFSPIAFIGGVVLCIVLVSVSSVASVSTGHTGVVTTFGKVESQTLEAGFHIKAPWNKVIEMDNRVQKSTTEMNCFSSDIQEVNMVYTVNYLIDKTNAQELYRTVGKEYYSTIVEPSVREAVKVATAKYTAEQLVQTRSDLARDIENLLKESLAKYNICVSSTAIEDMDFTDAFTNAVEAKQVAEQKKKQAEIEQAQQLAQAENDRKIAETNAKAEAEVAKIKAEADKEVAKIGADSAEYQGKKEGSIAFQRLASINGWTVSLDEETGLNKLYKPNGEEVTSEELKVGAERLIEYYYTQQWNGELPDTVLGETTDTLIGIN